MLDTVRPSLSLSLDLDNLWSYMKTHGDRGWESFPSYLDEVVDLVLDRLSAHGLRITFFIVGQDAAIEKNHAALRAIVDAGHEIGNHSFHHEPWLHLRTRAEIDAELALAEQAIDSATGRRPSGFRGPGFSLSADTLDVLSSRGYVYDASTLPTYLGPLARRYYLWKATNLSQDEREQRSRLFGTFAEGHRPLRPYLWKVGNGSLLEIPVTTMPGFRTPFHLSYVLYLAGFARQLGLGYLRSAALSCRMFGVQPSFLLHPLDFIGGDRVKQLAFFPGMNLPTAFKLDLFDEVADYLKDNFTVLTMEQHASKALSALQVPGAANQQVFAG